MLNWFINPYHDMEKITMEGLAYQMATIGVITIAGVVAFIALATFVINKFLK